MKVHVYDISQSEKMVYVRGVRYIKTNDKFNVVPIDVSVRKEEFFSKVQKIGFPFVLDISLVKGKGAIINGTLQNRSNRGSN